MGRHLLNLFIPNKTLWAPLVFHWTITVLLTRPLPSIAQLIIKPQIKLPIALTS